MDKTDRNAIDSSASEFNRTEKTAETLLRVTSMALSIAGLVIMIKNSVSNDFGSLSYLNLGAFMYLVIVNGVVTYAVLAAGAVSAETVYLAYYGNKSITWSSACDSYGFFCHKALISVVFTSVVSILYMSLSLFSSYRIFSRYEAP